MSVPDICVIGGGAAGHAIGLAAGAIGARCTLVDPRERLGSGQAAELAETMLFAAVQDRDGSTPFDLAAFRRKVGQALATHGADHTSARLQSAGVTVIRGAAGFVDPRTITVNGSLIRARRFVLATGAQAAAPDWADTLDPARLIRPADLITCAALPAAITILAAIPAGLEWAQALRGLGVAVTLVADAGVTAPFDPELIAPVLAALRREGVRLSFDTPPSQAKLDSSSRVMILGRLAPSVAALDLDRAGIAARDGAPKVDRSLRTTNRRVFALGDVLGRSQPGGAALPQQVGLVLRAALFRHPVVDRPDHIPITLRTRPALAQVGLMLPGPHQDGRRVFRFPLAETSCTGSGGVKIVASRRGQVLGAGVVGPCAADAIVPWTLAMARGIPLGAIAGLPVPASCAANASRRAALGDIVVRMRSPWIKRALTLLRLLP